MSSETLTRIGSSMLIGYYFLALSLLFSITLLCPRSDLELEP